MITQNMNEFPLLSFRHNDVYWFEKIVQNENVISKSKFDTKSEKFTENNFIQF